MEKMKNSTLYEGGVRVYKKKTNRKTALTKNYPKPKDRDRFRSKPKTAYKTIKTEDLHSSIQFTKR